MADGYDFTPCCILVDGLSGFHLGLFLWRICWKLVPLFQTLPWARYREKSDSASYPRDWKSDPGERIFSRISCIQNFFLSGLCLSAIVTTHMCRAHPCIQKLREWFIEPFSEFFVSIVLRCRNKKCSGFLNYFPIQRSASSMPQRFAPEYGNFMASKIFIRK